MTVIDVLERQLKRALGKVAREKDAARRLPLGQAGQPVLRMMPRHQPDHRFIGRQPGLHRLTVQEVRRGLRGGCAKALTVMVGVRRHHIEPLSVKRAQAFELADGEAADHGSLGSWRAKGSQPRTMLQHAAAGDRLEGSKGIHIRENQGRSRYGKHRHDWAIVH